MKGSPEFPFYQDYMPFAVAHQGGNLAGLEAQNTIEAFRTAYTRGVRYGETDTVPSSDSEPMAFHGSSGWFEKLRTGQPLRSDVEDQRAEDLQMTSITDLLNGLPDMRFFIDPKTDSAVEPLAETIRTLGAHERVSVGAFNYDRTRGVAELVDSPMMVTSFGIKGGLALLGGAMHSRECRDYIKGERTAQFTIPHRLATSRLVELAHDLGKYVVVWTPNEPDEILRSLRNWVDGVISDSTAYVQDMTRYWREGTLR